MHKARAFYCFFFLIVMAALLSQDQLEAQLQWPVKPINSDHSIVNCFGEYQYFNGTLYLHTGIDIREDCAPDGPWVMSVKEGLLKYLFNELDPKNPLYNGVIIKDGTNTPITTYRYGHLDYDSIQDEAWDAHNDQQFFPADEPIAQIGVWPTSPPYHHLHFDMIRNDEFVNPLTDLATQGVAPEADSTAPVVEEIILCHNDATAPVDFIDKPPSGCWEVKGDLDIIARAFDTNPPLPAGPYLWQGHTGIYSIEYAILELTGTGTHNLGPVQLNQFDVFSVANNGLAEAKLIYKNGLS